MLLALDIIRYNMAILEHWNVLMYQNRSKKRKKKKEEEEKKNNILI